MSSIDADGDEFMQPSAGAAAAAAAVNSVNKFARPTVLSSKDVGLFDFKGQPKNFDKQYAAIYFTRLRALKQTVLDAAARELAGRMQNGGEAAPKMCGRVLDIVPDRLCVIAGTIYKEMKLKPCIIEEYNKTAAAADATTQAGSVYTSPDDTLVLEDEFGRVGLIGSPDKLDVRELVSGVVVAVLGREAPGGKFEVEQLFIPDLAPQKSMPAMIAAASSSAAAAAASSSSSSSPSPPPAYLLCVSGLSFGAPGQDPTPIQLLMDYVTGLLGSSADQQSSARIVRVLFCGNSLHRFEKKKGKDFAREEIDPAVVGVPLRELDVLLTQLASAVPVDILPGEQDPSNFTLPQQPFHRCLFPSASTYSTFSSTTNPTWMEVNGLQVLATAGQNVNDLAKYCEHAATLDYLERTLRWRNVAPTAPDTLGCFPYQEEDPFVLKESPHIYLIGNQPLYSTRLLRGASGQKVRLVTLPSFAETGTAVLININSAEMETKPITFKVQQQASK